jgi:RNA polymerase sigma-70 factor (ECF subfamily)
MPTPDDAAPLAGADDQRTRFLERYQAWLRTLARLEIDTRFQGKFSASDAVQQTLLEAWRAWDHFRGDSEAERVAWLRGILAHQLAHLARHFAGTQKRDVAREVSLDASLARSSVRLGQVLADTGDSPSRQVESLEQQRHLAEVLERLPEDYRQVLVLRHLEQLSYDEIARRMNRGTGAARMLWVRALARLRAELST